VRFHDLTGVRTTTSEQIEVSRVSRQLQLSCKVEIRIAAWRASTAAIRGRATSRVGERQSRRRR
jgi:hypothetical protein